jgi:hypothetical protein
LRQCVALNSLSVIFIRRRVRKNLVTCYIWSTAWYGADTWTLRNVTQKHFESFEMWCWRRMEKVGWTERVKK